MIETVVAVVVGWLAGAVFGVWAERRARALPRLRGWGPPRPAGVPRPAPPLPYVRGHNPPRPGLVAPPPVPARPTAATGV